MEGRAIGRIVSFISLFVDGKYKTSNTGEKSKAVPMSLKSGKVMPPLFLPADIFYLICPPPAKSFMTFPRLFVLLSPFYLSPFFEVPAFPSSLFRLADQKLRLGCCPLSLCVCVSISQYV
jgi:hypothetical protein